MSVKSDGIRRLLEGSIHQDELLIKELKGRIKRTHEFLDGPFGEDDLGKLAETTNVQSFILSEGQVKKIDEWIKGHKKVNTGASGGRYTYSFTPTTLGVCVKVKDGITNEELGITECDDW